MNNGKLLLILRVCTQRFNASKAIRYFTCWHSCCYLSWSARHVDLKPSHTAQQAEAAPRAMGHHLDWPRRLGMALDAAKVQSNCCTAHVFNEQPDAQLMVCLRVTAMNQYHTHYAVCLALHQAVALHVFTDMRQHY